MLKRDRLLVSINKLMEEMNSMSAELSSALALLSSSVVLAAGKSASADASILSDNYSSILEAGEFRALMDQCYVLCHRMAEDRATIQSMIAELENTVLTPSEVEAYATLFNTLAG